MVRKSPTLSDRLLTETSKKFSSPVLNLTGISREPAMTVVSTVVPVLFSRTESPAPAEKLPALPSALPEMTPAMPASVTSNAPLPSVTEMLLPSPSPRVTVKSVSAT